VFAILSLVQPPGKLCAVETISNRKGELGSSLIRRQVRGERVARAEAADVSTNRDCSLASEDRHKQRGGKSGEGEQNLNELSVPYHEWLEARSLAGTPLRKVGENGMGG
jgi:hypothetical protein